MSSATLHRPRVRILGITPQDYPIISIAIASKHLHAARNVGDTSKPTLCTANMMVQPLRRFTLRPGRVVLALAGLLLLAITIFWAARSTTTQQPSFPVYTFDGRSASYLTIRANTGNNAIPNWLGYDPSLLSNRPLNQLDAKGRAVRQGQELECMMKGKVGSVAASEYQDIGDLVKYGYRASFTDHPNGDFIRELGLDKAFADLGLSSSGFVQVNAGNSFNGKKLADQRHALFSSSLRLPRR